MTEKFLIETATGIIEVEADIEVIAPQPGAQTIFLQRCEFEILFGGAAGGGKSYMLMLDALGLQFEHTDFGMPAYLHQDYRAVIFRRETTQLAKLIDYGKKMYLPLGAKFVLSRKGEVGSCFDFSDIGGGKIYLAHMEQESDKENHQGIEYQYIGFDELPHFTFTQYSYLFSRCRGVIKSKYSNTYLPNRIRATANPIGENVGWVRERFIGSLHNQLQPGKTYFFVASEDDYKGKQVSPLDKDFVRARSRAFIPSYLKDNKVLMEADPTYMYNIMQMGSKYEKALLNGDWFAFSGSFFDGFSKDLIIEPFEIPSHYPLFAAIDPGWSSPCSIMLATINHQNEVIILFNQYIKNQSPQQHAKDFSERLKDFPYLRNHHKKIDMFVAGLDAFAQKEKNSINATEETFARQFERFGFYLLPAKTERVPGWWAIKQKFQRRQLKFFDGYCEPIITELYEAVSDDNDPEDIKGRGNDPNVRDHALDSLRYLIYSIPALNVPETTIKTFKKVRYGRPIVTHTSQETVMSQ